MPKTDGNDWQFFEQISEEEKSVKQHDKKYLNTKILNNWQIQ
jgi:hypothetical protein